MIWAARGAQSGWASGTCPGSLLYHIRTRVTASFGGIGPGLKSRKI
jgi:hypothetical protein